MAMCLAGAAFAEEKAINDTKIYIVGSKKGSAEKVIHSKELPNGLYVVAYQSLGATGETDSPAINAFINGLIARRGFKIADHLEGSSMALLFHFIGSIDLSVVETQLSKTADTTDASAIKTITDKTATSTLSGSMAIQGALSGNQAMGAMGAAGVLGSFISTDKQICVTGYVKPNPEYGQGFFGGKVIKGRETLGDMFITYYRKAQNVRDITPEMKSLLEIAVNKWIDAFMVLDDEPVAVSGVPGTLSQESM